MRRFKCYASLRHKPAKVKSRKASQGPIMFENKGGPPETPGLCRDDKRIGRSLRSKQSLTWP